MAGNVTIAGFAPGGTRVQLIATPDVDNPGTGRLQIDGAVPGFNIPVYDEIDLTYDGSATDPITAVYKKAGATVATLTLTYDGSGRLTRTVRS